MKSGVVRKATAVAPQRPSWDEVDEYLSDGRHRALVEHHAMIDPDFADLLRWMRHDLEDETGLGDLLSSSPPIAEDAGETPPPIPIARKRRK